MAGTMDGRASSMGAAQVTSAVAFMQVAPVIILTAIMAANRAITAIMGAVLSMAGRVACMHGEEAFTAHGASPGAAMPLAGVTQDAWAV
jgi:hypothetical protein